MTQVSLLMQYLPPRLADLLSAPVLRLAVGDIRKVGLRKLSYGPNTQVARHRQVALIDIGTMDHLRAGRIGLHGDIARFTEDSVVFANGDTLAVDAVVLATGYRTGLEEFLVDWEQVCDERGVPLVSGRPTALPGLYFCAQIVVPAGMLRTIRGESRRIAAHINKTRSEAQLRAS